MRLFVKLIYMFIYLFILCAVYICSHLYSISTVTGYDLDGPDSIPGRYFSPSRSFKQWNEIVLKLQQHRIYSLRVNLPEWKPITYLQGNILWYSYNQ
jgi:hypothetical protein